MKILIIHNKYIEKGGEDAVAYNELSLLKSNAVNCDIMYFSNSGSSLLQFVKFILYPINIFSYFKIRKNIRRLSPDIVHVHNFFFAASPLLLWAAKHEKVPVVFTVHNFRLICPSGTLYFNGGLYLKSLTKQFSLQPSYDRVFRNSFFLTFWLSISNYLHFKMGTWKIPARYVFVSNFSKKIFEESKMAIYKRNFISKYNFIDVDKKSLNFERDDYFVFIGRLSEEKGIRTLMESFSGNAISLLIMGDGKMQNEVINFCKENENVKYLGFQKKTYILDVLSKAKALIFPSIWYECMPLTIVESFSVGTPVIASNIGAMSEMIIDGVNGKHFLTDSSLDLKDKINYFVNINSEEYKKMIYSTHLTFLERYSSEVNYAQLMDIYKSVL